MEHVTATHRPSPSTAVMCVVEPSRSSGPAAPGAGGRRPSRTRAAASSSRSVARNRSVKPSSYRPWKKASVRTSCASSMAATTLARSEEPARSRSARANASRMPPGRWRRVGQHVTPRVPRMHGAAHLRLVRRRGHRRRAFRPARPPTPKPAGDLPAVERLRALRPVALERVAELSEREDLPVAQDPALRRVDRRSLRLVGEDRLEDLEDERLLGVHLHAVACEPGRLADQLRERHRAEAPQRVGQPGRGAGHPARGRADVEDLRGRPG